MDTASTDRTFTLLICSVGGSPEPIAAALRHVQPARVLLWHSDDTRTHAVAALQQAGYDQNNADFRRAANPQALQRCVADMRRLHNDYQAWLVRSERHRVTVDFTGGTKVMSAAMALVAHRWECQFLYIAGSQRSKDGTGTVVTGSELPIQQSNPYDVLAYQPLQDAVQLFNHGQAGAAAQVLEGFTRRPDLAQSVKRQLMAVQHLTAAYTHWDAFRHRDAATSFENVVKAANDLGAALPGQELVPALERHRQLCLGLAGPIAAPSPDFVLDLLANADRRAGDQRFDDATARLYRATEAVAQSALRTDHQIDAGSAKLDQLPPEVQDRLRPGADSDGCLKLALQDDFAVLAAFGHPLGLMFRQLGLHGPTSPLSMRNQSILAHGFAPISEKAFKALRGPIHKLANDPDLSRFAFPSLSLP